MRKPHFPTNFFAFGSTSGNASAKKLVTGLLKITSACGCLPKYVRQWNHGISLGTFRHRFAAVLKLFLLDVLILVNREGGGEGIEGRVPRPEVPKLGYLGLGT